MTPTRTDPDKLSRQAADLAAQAAAAQAKVAEQHAVDQARLAEHQTAYDERLVADYRAADYEAAVEQSQRDLEAAVAESPITQALGRYLAAQVSRYDALVELVAARGRLGMTTAGAPLPPVADVLPVGEYVNRAAVEMAATTLAQQRETNHRNRNGEAPS